MRWMTIFFYSAIRIKLWLIEMANRLSDLENQQFLIFVVRCVRIVCSPVLTVEYSHNSYHYYAKVFVSLIDEWITKFKYMIIGYGGGGGGGDKLTIF